MRKIFTPLTVISILLLFAGCSAERDNAPRVDAALAYSLVREIYNFGPRPPRITDISHVDAFNGVSSGRGHLTGRKPGQP